MAFMTVRENILLSSFFEHIFKIQEPLFRAFSTAIESTRVTIFPRVEGGCVFVAQLTSQRCPSTLR